MKRSTRDSSTTATSKTLKYINTTRKREEILEKTQQRLTNHFSTNPLTDATSCKKCIQTQQNSIGGDGPMSALWKYIYYMKESGERIPSRTGAPEAFTAQFLDRIGEILVRCKNAAPPEGETWRGLVEWTAGDETMENIKWCLFLHSVRDNFFGMIERRCIWFCYQHHRHQLGDVTTLNWLPHQSESDQSDSDGGQPRPDAIQPNQRVNRV